MGSVSKYFPGSSRPSGASSNSQADYANIDQTIIIFDWDDTLCPSTWLRKNAECGPSGRPKDEKKSKAELRMLEQQVVPLLQLAGSLGKVIVVTNAKRPWVDSSCRSFIPQAKVAMKNIPVMYALELVQGSDCEERGCFLTLTKARAMKAAVSDFYSRYTNQSWKNIISIGDALFEHDAIRQVVRDRPPEEAEKKCRTKTVKLLEGPTIAGIVVQLSIIESWLPKIVQLDQDIDIDLSANEEAVNHWVALFGDGP